MLRKTLFVLMSGFALMPMGCGGCSCTINSKPPGPFTAYRVHNVERVEAHGVGSYSVWTVDNNTKIAKQEYVTSPTRKAVIKLDVDKGGEIWVEVGEKEAIIHIRSLDDIVSGRRPPQ
jgi:hypothetical protein